MLAKRGVFPNSIHPKLISKVAFETDGLQLKTSEKTAYSQNGRILVAEGKLLSCRSIKGELIWQREITGSNILMYAFGGQTLIVDKSRGDLSVINTNSGILMQKKDVGEIDQLVLYRDQFLAISSYKDKSVQVFDSTLERIGKVKPPSGDIIKFKYSKVEPRLLIYVTELVDGKISSFIYQYDKHLGLIATNDLGNAVVYDFDYLSDLIIIGSDWVGKVNNAQSQGSEVTDLTFDVDDIQGQFEQTASSEEYFVAQYLVTEGEEQGKSKLMIIDLKNNRKTISVANVVSDKIVLGQKFIISKELQNLFIYDYEDHFVGELSFEHEIVNVQWISSYKFLVQSSDYIYIYAIK